MEEEAVGREQGTTVPAARSLVEVAGWDAVGELAEVLYTSRGTTIERIVSRGHTTDWCDQDHDEWVLVHRGSATLEFADGRRVDVAAGDAILLPARCRHRVAWTDPEQLTVWLAVHFPPPDPQ